NAPRRVLIPAMNGSVPRRPPSEAAPPKLTCCHAQMLSYHRRLQIHTPCANEIANWRRWTFSAGVGRTLLRQVGKRGKNVLGQQLISQGAGALQITLKSVCSRKLLAGTVSRDDRKASLRASLDTDSSGLSYR